MDLPVVIAKDGKRFLWDGNHRGVSQIFLGARTMRVRLVELG